MKFRDSQDILKLWESKWGSLPGEWRNKFLSHPANTKILYYPDEWIAEAIKRNIKLDSALKLLEKSAEVHYPTEVPQNFDIETPEKYIERMERLFPSRENRIPGDDWWREQN